MTETKASITTDEMVKQLREMASQILSPGSTGKRLFEAIAARLEEQSAERAEAIAACAVMREIIKELTEALVNWGPAPLDALNA